MPASPASLLDAHEDRLQRVETGIAGLSVKVAEIGMKQDFHHQIQQEQNARILEKIEDLGRAEEKNERHLSKLENSKDEKSPWGELWPPWRFVRKYFLHICMALAGAMGHKGWQMVWELLK